MNQHIYLRAYMAGIVFPTILLLVAMTVFSILRYAYNFSVPVERIIVFPMAVVPNLWGLWNMLFIALDSRRRLPIGLHGAILPFVLAPIAFILTRLVGFGFPAFFTSVIPIAFPVALVLYYLAWKYVVGFLNRVQAIP